MKEGVAEALLLPALLQVLCRNILAHKENFLLLSVKVYIAKQFTGIPAVRPLLTIGYHQLAFTLQHIQDIVHRCLLQKQVPVLRHHILPDTFLQLLLIIPRMRHLSLNTAVIFLQDFIVTRVSIQTQEEIAFFIHILINNLLLYIPLLFFLSHIADITQHCTSAAGCYGHHLHPHIASLCRPLAVNQLLRMFAPVKFFHVHGAEKRLELPALPGMYMAPGKCLKFLLCPVLPQTAPALCVKYNAAVP